VTKTMRNSTFALGFILASLSGVLEAGLSRPFAPPGGAIALAGQADPAAPARGGQTSLRLASPEQTPPAQAPPSEPPRAQPEEQPAPTQPPPAQPPPTQPPSGRTAPEEGAPKESPYLQPDSRQAKPLSLKEAIAIAIANNLDVAIRKLDPESARFGIDQARAVFDPLFGSTGSYDRSAAGLFAGTGANPFQKSLEEKGSSLQTQATLSQTLQEGLTYQGTLTSTRSYSPGTPSSEKVYTSSLSLNVRQPLLRQFGFDVNRTDIEVAKLGVATSEEGFRRTVIDTLGAVENAYWDLSAAISNLDVAHESLKLANDLLALNRKKVEVGTLAPIQITEAEAGVASREEGVIIAQADIRNAEDNLRRIMNVPPDSPDWTMAITPSDKLPFEPAEIDLGAMIRAALEERPEIRQAKQDLRTKELRYRFSQNGTKPGLDALGSYSPRGDNVDRALVDLTGDGIPDLARTFIHGSTKDSVREVFDNVNYDWSVGLSLSIPIGNRAAKAVEAQTHIALEQSQLTLQNLERGIQVEVRTAVRAVDTGVKRVASARSNVVLQVKKLEAEQKRYDNGMSTSFQVLSFQNDLTAARSAEIAAITAYNKAVVDLGRVTATLPETSGVTIDAR